MLLYLKIMRFIIITCFPLLLFSQSEKEFYDIVYISGNVTYCETGKPVKVKERIKSNPKICFSNLNDYVIVWSSKRNELCLYPNKSKKRSKGFLQQYFSENLKSIEYLPTRGDDDAMSYLFFSNDKLLNPKKIRVFDIPKDKNSYYYLKYCSNNKILTKKLELDKKNNLFIDSNVINLKKGKNKSCSPTTAEIWYKQSANNSNTLELVYYLKDIDDINKELISLKIFYKTNNYSGNLISKKLKGYLLEMYGTDINIHDLKL